MAEISLSAYQNELERLLRDERHDEVIAHARHILKSQPKNLRTYRLLGDALIEAGRWEEAGNLFQRTLGAQPQDFKTHSQLAQAMRQQGQFERAIWHAERALDQKPSDQETTVFIRQLYRDHRNEEIERFQMSPAALAQRQIRGNLLAEALEGLATALESRPERVDWQLLRARALWLDGQRMEAAETALDILDRLPYAIDANRIMTELWLAEQRPSDAQPYLNRIEALDPYLARQMATGEAAPENLLLLERLDYSAPSQGESDIVNPEWLDDLGDDADADAESGGLGALLGLDESEAAPAQEDIAESLDDLLADIQVEELFSQLVIGETVASVSEAQPEDDEAGALLAAMEDRGFIDAASPSPGEPEPDAPAYAAQRQEADADADEASAELDGDLADLLERLDSSEDGGDWMADIQQGSLALDAADDSLEYLDDFDREWVRAGADDEAGGAPWLSAAMREAMDKRAEDDPFSNDQQLQNLLNLDSDTEPLHLSDMEDWLAAEPDAADEDDERALELDDELLLSPPADSWLDDGQSQPAAGDETEGADPNQRNAELIEGWGAELGDDDDDDDPYVDWLRDDPNELNDDELGMLSAPPAMEDERSGGADEQARAWGLDDAEQLADFVEESGGGEGAPDWLNAVVPGLDRENDAATDDANEYARPMSSPGKEFAWVSDIVEEETGEMKAIDPDDEAETPYFRFSQPPLWLTKLQERAGAGVASGATALSLDENIDALELDDLTFDDYFNFDTPTDKLDVISLDEDTQQFKFDSLDWDDYFELESPTEKTIAITLDEEAAELKYDALGIDDADFDFEAQTDEGANAGADIDFDGIGAGAELTADADRKPDGNRGGGPSTL